MIEIPIDFREAIIAGILPKLSEPKSVDKSLNHDPKSKDILRNDEKI